MPAQVGKKAGDFEPEARHLGGFGRRAIMGFDKREKLTLKLRKSRK